MRRLMAFVAMVIGVLAVGIAVAGPASAHAELVSSDPAAGSQLATAPKALTLSFTEKVTLVRGGIRLLDDAGRAVETAKPRADGQHVVVAVPGNLGEGAYVLTWRVVSSDSHPIQGAVPFAVGNATPVLASDITPQDLGARTLLAVARWVGFCGLVLMLGTALFVGLCWRAGVVDRGVSRLVLGGAGALLASTLVALFGQGPYAAGTSLTTAFDTSLVSATLATPYGQAAVFRIVAVLGLLLMLEGLRHKVTQAAVAGCCGLAAWILVTVAAQGHAIASSNWGFALVSQVIHLAAMAAWIGGLVLLLSRVLRPGVVATGHAAILTSWSRVAIWAVATLTVTGTFQSIREVGSVDALRHSSYGQILLVKLAIFVAMLGLANVGRMWVKRRYSMTVVHAYSVKDKPQPKARQQQPEELPPDLSGLRRSVAVETGLAVVVLAVTAVLVGTSPGRTASATPATSTQAAAPVSAAATLPGGIRLEVGVSTGRVVTVALRDSGGGPIDVQDVSVTASLAQRRVEHLPLPVTRVEPGLYRAAKDPLPFPGSWRVTVTARTSDIDSGVAAVTVTVR